MKELKSATVGVWINPPRRGGPDFLLDVYGYAPEELMVVPTGGRVVKASLRLAGVDPDKVTCSPFAIWPTRLTGGK